MLDRFAATAVLGVFANGSTTRPAGSTEIRQVNYTEGLKVGCRWYESKQIEPLFSFGHGLSYTTFEYSKLQVTPQFTTGSKEIRVRFRLTNTGDVAGTEVAQAYIELPGSANEPSKRLLGWEQVTLEPGEHENVEIALTADDLQELRLLQYWDSASETWKTAKGSYTVHVGGSVDTDAAAQFRIK